uniref:Uncharacterized protein n=1 Tax=Moumouvirus sp. 'Monve' TaxID=1128131 RepID=H2EFC2_9VIRU|nr:hypothetical protein mv_R985 [Moumouvirus Monve]
MDILTNEIGDEKLYEYKGFDFKLVKTTEYNSETLVDKIENGDNLYNENKVISFTDFERSNRCLLSCILQCGNYETEPDDFYGFIRTINGIYLIIGNFSNFCGFDDDDDNNENLGNINVIDQVKCNSPEPGIIDIYYTPIKQN